jgi:hypothetical protein
MQANNRTASLHNVFVGNGRYTLSLPIGPLQDLEDALGLGVSEILIKLAHNTWRSRHIVGIVQYGLIGGGMNPEAAFDLVNSYVVSGYLSQYAQVAMALIQAALVGIAADPVGEPQPTEVETTTDQSNGPVSTKSAARRASPRKKSEK